MTNHEYSEKQKKIISGEIPIESVNGQTLRWFYEKAIANNDQFLADKIKTQQDKLKKAAYKRNMQYTTESRQEKRMGTFQWQQPKSNEYTEHQKQVVRGDVAYENIHTKELISIHLKAYNNGDYELSERMLDLINTRREDAQEKEKQNHKTYKRLFYKRQQFATERQIGNINRFLSQTEQAILLGVIDKNDCSEKMLIHILEVANEYEDKETIALAERLLFHKRDPDAAYIVRDHYEAIDLIESLLQMPIRRPETWFVG